VTLTELPPRLDNDGDTVYNILENTNVFRESAFYDSGGIGIVKKILLILLRLLSIPYGYMVLLITLLYRQPLHTHNIKPPFWEISELIKGNERILFDIIANIIMFFPLGVFLPLWIKKADTLKKVALISLVVSLSIEIIQLITTRGYFEIDDLFHNTLGAVIGALIGCPLAKRIFLKDNDGRKQ